MERMGCSMMNVLRALTYSLLLTHFAPQGSATPGLWSRLDPAGAVVPSGSAAERRIKAHEYYANNLYLEAARELMAR